MKGFAWIGIGLAAAAAGCATRAEPPPPPAAFVAAPGAEAPIAREAWIATFATPEVEALVAEALTSNPGLAAAEARARAQRLRARAAFGRWLPDLEAGLGATRTGTPNDAGDRIEVNSLTSRVSVSWEADLWGRVLDGARAAGATARAAEADLDAARLSVAGQTARAWTDLVAAELLLDLAREDLESRARALEITERRYGMGVSDSLAVRTARSQSASAQAALAAAEDDVRAARRRLETLLGRYPGATFDPEAPLPKLPAIAAPGAPTALLARRPDVAAAEARLDAAGFRVSEARKALLPRLTLTATGTGADSQLADVIDPDRWIAQAAAGLLMPVFQGGALRNEAKAADADAKAAAADYVETALDAWREVEDALSADESLAVRETELDRAAEEARQAQALAERQYANGVATIFELIDAYTRRIDAERGLIAARSQRVTNRIAYHVALGGGAETGGLGNPDDATEGAQ